MPTFKSEINAIIGQIRAGNNDPELLANALQAIVESTPYGSAYYELTGLFVSRGPNLSPIMTVLNNTFPFDWMVEPASELGADVLWSIKPTQDIETVFNKNPDLTIYTRDDISFVSSGDAFGQIPVAFLSYCKEESNFDVAPLGEVRVRIGCYNVVSGELVNFQIPGDPVSFSIKLWRK